MTDTDVPPVVPDDDPTREPGDPAPQPPEPPPPPAPAPQPAPAESSELGPAPHSRTPGS